MPPLRYIAIPFSTHGITFEYPVTKFPSKAQIGKIGMISPQNLYPYRYPYPHSPPTSTPFPHHQQQHQHKKQQQHQQKQHQRWLTVIPVSPGAASPSLPSPRCVPSLPLPIPATRDRRLYHDLSDNRFDWRVLGSPWLGDAGAVRLTYSRIVMIHADLIRLERGKLSCCRVLFLFRSSTPSKKK